MAQKESTRLSALVFALAFLVLADLTIAGSGLSDPVWDVQASTKYPEGCIRSGDCPADTGATCKSYRIRVLPCSCNEVKRCDPTASGCSESTIAGLRSCGF